LSLKENKETWALGLLPPISDTHGNYVMQNGLYR